MLDGPMMRSPLRRARVTRAGTSMSVPSTDVTITAPRMRLAMQASIVAVESRRGDGDDGEGHLVGQVVDRSQARMAVDRVVARVDGVHRDVDAVDHVAPDRVADRARSFGCADHGDRTGQQDPRHRSRVGTLLASFDAVEELVGVGQFPVEVDDAGIEAALQRPAGLGEHGEHRPVVAEHLGGEPLDAVGAGDRGQVFQQQRGDAVALVGVVDHEGGLGLVASRPSLVARPGDELVVRLDDERRPIDHVDIGEVVEFLVVQFGLGREVPPVDALGRLPPVELGERRPVVGGERADEHGVTVAEHDRRCPRRFRRFVAAQHSHRQHGISGRPECRWCDVCCTGPTSARVWLVAAPIAVFASRRTRPAPDAGLASRAAGPPRCVAVGDRRGRTCSTP